MTASNPSKSKDPIDSPAWWVVLAVIVLGFIAWTFGELRNATSPRWQDTSGYLAHALYVAEHGGLLGFFREAFTGVFPIAERHPLYFLMIAPFAERTADFFWWAKIVDLITGLAVLLSLVWMVNRRYGSGPALIAGAFYALSNSLVTAAAHVDNETQFTLCALWMWWFLTEAPSRDGNGPPLDMPESTRRWAIAGALLGLAFLAKSPAVLVGVAVAVAGVWHARWKFITGQRAWAFLAATLIVASPLLVRNIVGHGALFYESINSRMMWLDDWADVGADESVFYYDQYGVTTVEKDGYPTAADYFRTHSIGEFLTRIAKGVYGEVTQVAPDALGSPVLPRGGRSLGFVVLALAAGGWWLRRRSWEGTFVFFWSGAFIAFFGWDKLFPEMRYLAPLVPVWIALAAYAAWRILQAIMSPLAAWRLQAAGICAVTLFGVGGVAASGSLTEPREVMSVSPSYSRYVDSVNRNAEPGDRFMIGETHEFHGLIWMIEPKIEVVVNPSATSLEGFLRYLSERRVRYLLMHAEYLTGLNRGIAAALDPYFGVTAEGEFFAKQPLPGWRPIYEDEGPRKHFILYEAADYETTHTTGPASTVTSSTGASRRMDLKEEAF